MDLRRPACPRRRACLVAAAAAACGWRAAQSQSPPARVAAADDLQIVLPEIAAAFRRLSGRSVEITYGPSGDLARRIREGEPLDLFLADDETEVLQLADGGLTRDRGFRYAASRTPATATGTPAAARARRLVLMRDARPAAADFQLFLVSPAARRIFAAHGFAEPPGAP